MKRRLVSFAALAGAGIVTGCASFSPDGGFGLVEQTARERLGKQVLQAHSEADLNLVDQRVAELLARPLTVDDAVAYEWTGSLVEPARLEAEGSGSMPPLARPATDTEVKVRKPGAGSSPHLQH